VAARIIRWACAIWKALVRIFWPLILIDIIVRIIVMICYPKGARLKALFRHTEVIDNPSKMRCAIAKAIALAWYCWGCLAYLVWPALLLYTIVYNENSLSGLPEAEPPQAVGQWSPWVGVGLAVTAGIASKAWSARKTQEKDTLLLNDLELNTSIARQQTSGCYAPDRKARWYHRWDVSAFLIDEWKDLECWWKDPIEASNVPLSLKKPKMEKEEEELQDFMSCSKGGTQYRSIDDAWANLLERPDRTSPHLRQPEDTSLRFGYEQYFLECEEILTKLSGDCAKKHRLRSKSVKTPEIELLNWTGDSLRDDL
jgi:hypothetical protein